MSYIAKHLSTFNKKEVVTLLKKGKRVCKDVGLDIISAPATLEFGRILVITPRKAGNAPARNKIRRRLKALFYQKKLYERLTDICIIIKKPGITYTSDQLEQFLDRVFT